MRGTAWMFINQIHKARAMLGLRSELEGIRVWSIRVEQQETEG